jgi:hypothetical protein
VVKKMNKYDKDGQGEKYLMQIMMSEDPNLLRSAALEMVVVVGHMYKRIQLHVLLHPAFFLAGFLSCYYFIK